VAKFMPLFMFMAKFMPVMPLVMEECRSVINEETGQVMNMKKLYK